MNNFYKAIIAGSRSFNNYAYLKEKVNEILEEIKKQYDVVIISGAAKGADSLGELYAEEMGYKIEKYPANWGLYGKSAGYKRNLQMGEVCNGAIIFWDGKSKGSKHMINIMKKLVKPFRIVYV